MTRVTDESHDGDSTVLFMPVCIMIVSRFFSSKNNALKKDVSLLRLSRLLAVRFYSHSVAHDAPLVRPFDEVPGPRGKFAVPYIGTMLFSNSIGVCACKNLLLHGFNVMVTFLYF